MTNARIDSILVFLIAFRQRFRHVFVDFSSSIQSSVVYFALNLTTKPFLLLVLQIISKRNHVSSTESKCQSFI